MGKVMIVDYGVGNLFSLRSSLAYVGADAEVVSDPDKLRQAERVILPGVGAFPDAARKLRECGMWSALYDFADTGRPLFGICLGMQLLLEKSLEYGEHAGLGFIPGTVREISSVIGDGYKIPHMGWNRLDIHGEVPLYREVKEGDHVYFVHSFFADCSPEYITADTEYGARLTASVARDNVMGTQFHPEKSGEVGMKILSAFCEL